ncbi:MAG: 3-deoxy-7-phosphoheptulonate synthase [Candidatus Wallbacteria bacterium]|nr:3-deoxy-7-phosphoheptulonate synthase [Candidatus Wallbacteria bacterium]
MLVVMKRDTTPQNVERVCQVIREKGFTPHVMPGAVRLAIGVTGNQGFVEIENLEGIDGVLEVIHVTSPHKLVSRDVHPEDTVVTVAGVAFGGKEVVVMAGPCAVESREQVMLIAREVKRLGARMLRGGAFKPRTSPYAFQGLKKEGLEILAEARAETGLPIVTEVKDTDSLELVASYADLLQIGARNMQNFTLLEEVGKLRKPVLLKRGMSATIKELLLAAEYIMSQGNYQVILCERGIRTFEDSTRNTLDLNAVPVLKGLSHLPVVVDPSHGIGLWSKVTPMARAAVAAGADGLIIEVHHDPQRALSDGPQSLTPKSFAALMTDVRRIAGAVDREVAAGE